MDVARLLVVVSLALGTFGCGSRSGLRGDASQGSASDGDAATVTDGGAGDGLADTALPVTLTGVGVTPALAGTGVGLTATFVATGRYSDGSTRDLTAMATWAATPPSVATITGGVARGVAAGMATIRATVMNQTGTATLTVTAAKLTSLGIDPPTANIPVNAPFPLRATGVFSDGTKQDLTGQAAWSASDATVLAVAAGVLTGLKGGTATVTATLQGVSASAVITVTEAGVVSLEVAPASAILPLPGNQQFSATAVYSNGSKGDVSAAVTWQSSDTGVITISARGLAAAVAAGTATVSARLGAVTGMASVTVGKAALTALTVAPATATVARGTTAPFTASARFADGTSADVTGSVAWSSSNEMVATVSSAAGSQGLATGLGAGTAQITATVAGFTASATFTVTAAKVMAIAVSPPAGTIALGGVLALHAQALFDDGTSRDVTDMAAWSSDGPAASVSNAPGSAGQVTGLQAGSVQVRAAFGGLTGMAMVVVNGATLVSLTVAPPAVSLMVGARQALTATGSYSDGTTTDVTARATWSSDGARIASVSNAAGAVGQVTGVAAGTTTVHARLDGQDGTAAVTVTAPGVTQISIAPLLQTRRVGQNVAFTASAVLSNNTTRNVTNQTDWSSSDPRVATIDSMGGGRGQAMCVGPGTATITAMYMGGAATTTLVCNVATLMSLEVSPILSALQVGQRQQLNATALYSDGSTVNVTNQTTWSSSATATASVSNQMGRGQVTALAAGMATISAAYMGMMASAQVTVTDATLTRISLAPVTASLRVGQSQGFTATGVYSDGTTRNVTGMAVWSSSAITIASVSNQGGNRGQVTALAAGTATITATFMALTDTGTVTVTAPKLVSIGVTPVASHLLVGQTAQFTATALFDDGTTANVTGAAIFSTSDATIADVVVAGMDRGQVSALKAGTATISASYMGQMDSTTVTVADATVTTVQVTPASPTMAQGASVQFQAVAVYSDGSIRNVTNQAAWSSSAPMIADVSNAGGSRGQVTALALGSADVTATVGGTSGKSTLTVAAVTEIQVTPASPSLPAGVTRAFQAVAVFANLATANVTASVTWSSSDPAVATVSNAGGRGVATTVAAGTTTIRAALGSASGTSTLTVGAQTLTSITVNPGMAMLAPGATVALAAIGTYSDGSTYPLTDQVTWISTAPGLVAVSNVAGSQGLATGIAAGSGMVEAHFGGMTGAAAVVVTAAANP